MMPSKRQQKKLANCYGERVWRQARRYCGYNPDSVRKPVQRALDVWFDAITAYLDEQRQ